VGLVREELETTKERGGTNGRHPETRDQCAWHWGNSTEGRQEGSFRGRGGSEESEQNNKTTGKLPVIHSMRRGAIKKSFSAGLRGEVNREGGRRLTGRTWPAQKRRKTFCRREGGG